MSSERLPEQRVKAVRKRKRPRASGSKEDVAPLKMRKDGGPCPEEDVEIKRLLRENSSLAREASRQARTIQELEKRLGEERAFYEEQKGEYVKEMRSRHSRCDKSFQTDLGYQGDPLAEELRRARDMILRQRAAASRLFGKFVRLRENKNSLLRRFEKAEAVYGAVIEQLMRHLAEARVTFLTSEKRTRSDNRRMDELVERTAKYAYNNAALHVQLLKQERIIEEFRSNHLDRSVCCKCCSKSQFSEEVPSERVKAKVDKVTYLSSKLRKAKSEEAPRRRKGRSRHSKSVKG